MIIDYGRMVGDVAIVDYDEVIFYGAGELHLFFTT